MSVLLVGVYALPGALVYAVTRRGEYALAASVVWTLWSSQPYVRWMFRGH